MREIEILWKCETSLDKALAALSTLRFEGKKSVVDVYFYDPLRDKLRPSSKGRINECFRLRSKDGECSIAYKVDHYELDVWQYSDEEETPIGDFRSAFAIIGRLGLRELVRIDNTKYVYSSQQYEIVLESVVDLGLFVEIEAKGVADSESVSDVKADIRSFLSGLGLVVSEELNSGKPELMLKKKYASGEIEV